MGLLSDYRDKCLDDSQIYLPDAYLRAKALRLLHLSFNQLCLCPELGHSLALAVIMALLTDMGGIIEAG